MSAQRTYLLFEGENYYPVGGWDDLAGKYDSLDAAKAAFDPNADWAQIVDMDSCAIVLKYGEWADWGKDDPAPKWVMEWREFPPKSEG